jgi:hypothetical protein
VRDYPAKDRAVQQAKVTREIVAATDVMQSLRAAGDRRLRPAKVRRMGVLNTFLERPAGVDPVTDRLDRAERLRRLEAIDPAERGLMLRTAAREGTHPELLRAALLAEAPPWATPTWQPLLPDAVVEEIREWTIARLAPETVADLRAVWCLRRRADELEKAIAEAATRVPARAGGAGREAR